MGGGEGTDKGSRKEGGDGKGGKGEEETEMTI